MSFHLRWSRGLMDRLARLGRPLIDTPDGTLELTGIVKQGDVITLNFS